MPNLIYVLDLEGNPLMPSNRFKHFRLLLKDNKAKIVSYNPFVVQLLYDSTHYVDSLTFALDPGRDNIGCSVINANGKALFRAKVKTRNKEIPKLMKERKSHRQASRSGERKVRQRLAVKYNTIHNPNIFTRILPNCEKPITCKYIKNTQAKFSNRKRPDGWFTPTANQLLQTHLNLYKLITKFLPVTKCVIELNKFDFVKMENPGVKNWEYQKGILFGKESLQNAVSELQNCHCLLCSNPIEEYHHIVEQSKGGSNTINNIAGLCEKHHTLVHTDEKIYLKVKAKKEGLLKKYGALSVLNQIMPSLLKEFSNIFGDYLFISTGQDTKNIRDKYSIPKDHDLDAYCIGISSLNKDIIPNYDITSFTIKQFRRHNRQLIHRQTERTYKLDGKIVAKNRRKRMSQTENSLHEWYIEMKQKYGKTEARRLQSKLEVVKSKRSYRNKASVLPGTEFIYKKKRYTLTGTLTNGQYYRAYGQGSKNFKASECKIVKHNKGLVFV